MSKSTKTQLTAQQLQSKLAKMNEDTCTMTPEEYETIAEHLKDERVTQQQLIRALITVQIGEYDDHSYNMIRAIRERSDFENLIIDKEFQHRFLEASKRLERMAIYEQLCKK